VAVRGAPVINDATRADAAFAGLAAMVPVIDNGSDAPGTMLDDCSPAFRQAFDRADLVIHHARPAGRNGAHAGNML